MRKLEMPSDDPSEVFLTCISRVRNPRLRARLMSVEPDIVDAADKYKDAAAIAMLHTLVPQDNIGGVVSKDEMIGVYEQRMAKIGKPGRPIYDKLIAAPLNGRCPLCGQRIVSTLDHHLPKAHYPALAVVPFNLVPACRDCNKVKLEIIPKNGEEQTLHPYFDDVESDPWLYAEVIQASPAALRFFVNPPDDWDDLKTKRVRFHFKVFRLAALYASHAAGELHDIRHFLSQLLALAGPAVVKNHLQEQAESREKAHKNSWQTAMYKALAANDWFCEGGLQQ